MTACALGVVIGICPGMLVHAERGREGALRRDALNSSIYNSSFAQWIEGVQPERRAAELGCFPTPTFQFSDLFSYVLSGIRQINTRSMGASRKQTIFWAILIALPLMVLALAELSLRMAGYGGNLDLVVTKSMFGKTYYTLNPLVARRYFTSSDIALPEPSDDIFTVTKPPQTKRIFMLGESTMAGFPYDYNATAPSLLRNRLEEMLPQYHFEVVNVGMSAISSYTVVDFARDLRAYQPDAYVVYLGHNEFYGALGVGSTESLGKSRSLIRLSLALEKSKVYLLLRDAIAALRRFISHPLENRSRETLMEAMVGSRTIPYHSDDYTRARENFAANLREIISISAEAHIPLVLSTLTSNIHDQKPLQPVFSEGTTPEQQHQIQALLANAESGRASGDPGGSLNDCKQAISIDSLYAPSHFAAARALEALHHMPEAKAQYEMARDYDGLRFRASTDFNELIRSVARSAAIPVADADSAFDASSPSGIVGSSLMLEHLHPNFDGYLLLAKVYAQTLRSASILGPADGWRTDSSLSDAHFKQAACVTDLDLLAGAYRIQSLTSRWPFTASDEPAPFPPPANMVEETALRFVRKQIRWSDAHYSLGDRFRAQHDYPDALREYRAVAKAQPYYYYPLMLIGDVYRAMNDDTTAYEFYERGLTRQNSPFLHVRLGTMLYERNRLDDAIREFHLVFASEESEGEQLQRRDRALAYYFLGVTFGKKGDLAQARSNLRMAGQIDPQNPEIRTMLKQLHIE